jgi:hypothetical protein
MNFTYSINHPFATHATCERSSLLRWVWLMVIFDDQYREPVKAGITDDFGNLQEVEYRPVSYRD